MRSNLVSQTVRARLWWAILWLSPVAYLLSFVLYLPTSPLTQVHIVLDRDELVALARKIAHTKGIEADSWTSYLKTETDDSRYFYYRYKKNTDLSQVRAFAPELTIHVLLVAPEQKENIEFLFSPAGQLVGYQRRFANDPNLQDGKTDDAEKIATAAFAKRPEANLVPPDTRPNSNEERFTGNAVRKYTWQWKQEPWSELANKTLIFVRNNEVIGEGIESTLDENFTRERISKSNTPIIIFAILYGLIAFIVVIFGIFRFAERMRQNEISFVRIAIIAISIAAIYGGFIFLADVSIYDQVITMRGLENPFLNRLFSSIVWVVIGTLLGLAYASGEGDVRELYPGKLTALDTLLEGKIFSRNVAQSFIRGLAISGWLLLVTTLAVFIFVRKPYVGWKPVSYEMYYADHSWLLGLLSWPAEGFITALFVILLPLPFLHRRLKNPRLILGLLFLLSVVATGINNIAVINPWYLGLLPAIFSAVLLLFTFFKFDLLTAILSLSGSNLWMFVLMFYTHPAQTLHRAGVIIGVISALALLAATYFYTKGREYDESEVRPLYAKHLAERLSLQAEVSAAREAQIRLLPDSIPAVHGLQVAAACYPAHEVGGDFYDFFELEPGKLGVFMAEGGGQGLASALTIAFAKGYLMPRIRSNSFSDNSPAEIVRGLKSHLAKKMDQDHELGFIYAVLDTSDNTLRFAKTGAAPTIHINAKTLESQPRPGESAELIFHLSEEESFSLIEGMYHLETGDTITFFTDGMSHLLKSENDKQKFSFWQTITDGSHSQVSLQAAVQAGARHFTEVTDDLTVVNIHLKEDQGNKQ